MFGETLAALFDSSILTVSVVFSSEGVFCGAGAAESPPGPRKASCLARPVRVVKQKPGAGVQSDRKDCEQWASPPEGGREPGSKISPAVEPRGPLAHLN